MPSNHAEQHFKQGLKIREIILGMQDGVVSNLGVVLGVSYGIGEPRIALIAGLAAVFAEGTSMLFSQYSASRSLRQFIHHQIQIEKKEIQELPATERQEIKDIYRKKGFRGKQLENIVDTISKDREVWLETMKNEELRWLPLDNSTPLKDAFVVGIAAIISGLFPVWPFAFFGLTQAIPLATLSAATLLFGFGIAQTRITGKHWLQSGAELLLIGAAAALTGFVVGTLLQGIPV